MPTGPRQSPAGSANDPPAPGRGPWGRTSTACKASGPHHAEKEPGGPGSGHLSVPHSQTLAARAALLQPGPARSPASGRLPGRWSPRPLSAICLFIQQAFIGHQPCTRPGAGGFRAHPCHSGAGLITIPPRPPWARRQGRERASSRGREGLGSAASGTNASPACCLSRVRARLKVPDFPPSWHLSQLSGLPWYRSLAPRAAGTTICLPGCQRH